jgi:hypothetical protein
MKSDINSKLTAIIFLLSVSFITQAQVRVGSEIPGFIYQSFFTKIGSECWGYGGIDIVESSSMALPFSNPASMSEQQAYMVLDVTKRFQTSDPYEFSWDNQYILPSYAAVQFPVNGLNLTAGYADLYNLQLVLEDMPITTVQQPSGTGQFFDATFKIQIHTFFAAIQYPITSALSVGLMGGANYFTRSETVYRSEAEASAWGWQAVLGLIYSPNDRLRLGTSFRYLNNIRFSLQYTGDELLPTFQDPGTGGHNRTIVANLQDEFVGYARFPWDLKVGLSYHFRSKFRVFGMINIQDWSRVGTTFKDVHQFHFGLQTQIRPRTILSIGIFTQLEGENSTYSLGKYLDQIFVTVGCSQKLYNDLQFNISLMDSRLFSNAEVKNDFGENAEQFHQTQLILGIQYIIQ